MAITNAHTGAMLIAVGRMCALEDISPQEAMNKERQAHRIQLYNGVLVAMVDGQYHMTLSDMNRLFEAPLSALIDGSLYWSQEESDATKQP